MLFSLTGTGVAPHFSILSHSGAILNVEQPVADLKLFREDTFFQSRVLNIIKSHDSLLRVAQSGNLLRSPTKLNQRLHGSIHVGAARLDVQ